MIKSKIVAHYTGGHIQKSGLTSIARLTDLLFLPSFLPLFIYFILSDLHISFYLLLSCFPHPNENHPPRL